MKKIRMSLLLVIIGTSAVYAQTTKKLRLIPNRSIENHVREIIFKPDKFVSLYTDSISYTRQSHKGQFLSFDGDSLSLRVYRTFLKGNNRIIPIRNKAGKRPVQKFHIDDLYFIQKTVAPGLKPLKIAGTGIGVLTTAVGGFSLLLGLNLGPDPDSSFESLVVPGLLITGLGSLITIISSSPRRKYPLKAKKGRRHFVPVY